MSARIAIMVEEEAWRGEDLRPAIRRAARAALKSEGRSGALTILLAGDATLRRLNREYRARDTPTNVLSFPAPPNPEEHLGDIAIAYQKSAAEAAAAGRAFADHVLHLAVHGVLHLLGYDHETDAEAAVMEPKEICILAALGIADPYACTV